MPPSPPRPAPPWSVPIEVLLAELGSGPGGLSAAEAAIRLRRHGSNRLASTQRAGAAALLLRQFSSPIILILLGAALLSFALDSPTDGLIIVVIVAVSGLLGFWQDFGASRAVKALLAVVEQRATVLRDGEAQRLPVSEIVPGDVLVLAAGAGIPADCRLLEERHLALDEAALSGESLPVDKDVAPVAAEAALARRTNLLHMGSHVVSGSGRAVVIHTGAGTTYGRIAARLAQPRPETEFERGVRRFGTLLLEMTLLLITLIFAFNVALDRPVVSSFLFALALGVGLTPQLLPAIISVNLAHGARGMARQQVIVKRLTAIENFGSMDVLCSDKTGTLTEGSACVQQALSADGQPSAFVLAQARLNALFETGFSNPIDEALRELPPPALSEGVPADPAAWRKRDERPFDFHRKRQSVLLEPAAGGTPLLICKGSLAAVLQVCTLARCADGALLPLADLQPALLERYRVLSAEGRRVLGVASRQHPPATIGPASEQAMTFLGLLVLSDPLKAGITATVAELAGLGVRLKIITGDNALVAARIGAEAGLVNPAVITGRDLQALSDQALPVRAEQVDVFAEVEPNQKERLIRALRRAGHVVGYIGDGINDAPALLASDVGLSVQGAVDVAREAADIVLLENDLGVLSAGIREGRRTFANTLKYVFMASSANFGNMLSMAAASLLLPFLPLLPKQILLTNLLTDLPEMTIAGDRVDHDWIARPRRWDIAMIRRFMLCFGLVSSLFDGLTFAALLLLLRSDTAQFRTGWFMESVVSAASIVLVVRSRRPLLSSRPSRWLVAATLLVIAITLALPATPAGRLFGFVPLPAHFYLPLTLILLAYVICAEQVKRWFFHRHNALSGPQRLP
ncbi:MAG: magnesium-translocating P-type ATPase [Synechococcaceae cyanobacterium]|nr:magnesium-translocating P-type ATPase [Synechococcaceae cyanobacterium]